MGGLISTLKNKDASVGRPPETLQSTPLLAKILQSNLLGQKKFPLYPVLWGRKIFRPLRSRTLPQNLVFSCFIAFYALLV